MGVSDRVPKMKASIAQWQADKKDLADAAPRLNCSTPAPRASVASEHKSRGRIFPSCACDHSPALERSVDQIKAPLITACILRRDVQIFQSLYFIFASEADTKGDLN